MRGVALRVPHVMSCFTAAGPSSDAVGEGMFGTREKLLEVGDLGRSVMTRVNILYMRYGIDCLQGVPEIAALIRLRVGLGGADIAREDEGDSSCPGRRVLLCLIDLGSPVASAEFMVFG